jgi:hypothetical protein
VVVVMVSVTMPVAVALVMVVIVVVVVLAHVSSPLAGSAMCSNMSVSRPVMWASAAA